MMELVEGVFLFFGMLFAVGTVPFFLLMLAFLVGIVSFVTWEMDGAAAILLFFLLGGYQLFSEYPVVTWLLHNPLAVFYGFLAYFTVGTAYATGRYVLALREAADDLIRLRKESYNLSSGYTRNIFYHYDKETDEFKIHAHEHKTVISRWISWWPFSLLSWVFGDMVRRLVKEIWLALQNFYQRLADNAMRRVNALARPKSKTATEAKES